MRRKILETVALAIVTIFPLIRAEAHPELTPPYFNLAEGKAIQASATCGVDSPGPELYCQLTGANSDLQEEDINLIQGQVCDYCDVNIPSKSHPPEHAVDGLETWWQSPPLSRGRRYEEVNLTIDLGQEFHVAYLYVKMGKSPRPEVWVLEKSKDYGKTFTPWQYFADSDHGCQSEFGIPSHTPITRDDTVICTTEYSQIVPLEFGEIPISILNNRPSAKHYFNSTILQEWTRATNVRFRFLKTKNLLGHLMSVRRQDPTVTRRYFYSIQDINIGGRCMCNGHADTCEIADANMPKLLHCRCQHNTCGPQCATCCSGFEQKKWRQSTAVKKFTCEPCNCFGHSDECVYDEEIDQKHLSLDIHGNYEGGGVCQNCKHNTEGINCNHCKPTYYRIEGKELNATDICQPCVCNEMFSTGNCSDFTGQCECKPQYTPPDCNACSYGYFGYPNCKPCECFLNGTDGYHCEAVEGQCPCKNNYGGHYCNYCAEGYYDFPTCLPCACNPRGSLNNVCEVITGNCTCKTNYGGRQCDACENGYYDYPTCSYCNCDEHGTEPGICDKDNGRCLCKEGYGGPRCDQCINGYYGYPNCRPCNCSKNGTTSISCDVTGKCSCMSNFVGKTCNQCAPGYFNYPECTACNCNSHGSIGVSCDQEGKCTCRDNFDGDKCDKCRDGFYNFPTCEGCNCDPAGVLETFAGCGSMPAGELCQCKERVEGRICNKCKRLFWNLQPTNPDACEECHCHKPGTVGGIGECDTKSGQCVCKPKIEGRDCSTCLDGTYGLEESNLFGCSECNCDIGGSENQVCDKQTGQCVCRTRIEGATCKSPIRTAYFPTLHQFQYEAEDGKTPNQRQVRYGFAEDLFPGYSWRGYAVFSPLQKEIFHEVMVDKPSTYRMVMRYVNLNADPILGSITFTPESHTEVKQDFKVLLKPARTPTFVTVSGPAGRDPVIAVMNPGLWTVSIATDKNLLLDYFVILPADYYEATILTQEVSSSCQIGDKTGLCRHFAYPSLASYDTTHASSGYINDGRPINTYFEDRRILNELKEEPMAMIDRNQHTINFDLPISKPGPHVLVVTYYTPDEIPNYVNETQSAILDARTPDNVGQGQATLYPCRYSSICRQVFLESNGRVAIFNFTGGRTNVALSTEGGSTAVKSLVAVPLEEWSIDYLKPKSVCVIKDGVCVPGAFPEAPEAKKIELELNNQVLDIGITPEGIHDKTSKLVRLGGNEEPIDISGKVPSPGAYVFVVQYYQPDHPEFDVDVVVQSGNGPSNVKDYEAEVSVTHCPSSSSCRAVIRQVADGETQFQLVEDFVVTLKGDNERHVDLDYILVIPADSYDKAILKKLKFDQTKEFIKKCGANQFYVNTSDTGFCRDSVFSLTTNYNNGALSCNCNATGSLSFECEKFGGQCPCKANIIGQRCNICKTGYFGFPDCRACNCPSVAVCEPDTGACICPSRVRGELCDECEPGTYGYDPINGCEECSCSPYGTLNGDLQCDLMTGDCSCKEFVVGRQCDRCEAGHFQFPHCERCNCDVQGTVDEICDQETSECKCKSNVHGAQCDICRDGMFNLQSSNAKGCTECFCFGKTTRCSSAQLLRTQIMDMSDWDLALVSDKNGTVEILLETRPQQINDSTIVVRMRPADDPKQIVYFSAPPSYLSKKLTSYGGWLNYTLHYTTGQYGQAVPGSDVILQGRDLFLIYRADEEPPSYYHYGASLNLVETNFQTQKGNLATREQFMTVLEDLQAIYIRATYWQPSPIVTLSYVSLDTAYEGKMAMQGAENASSVEHCQCPPNYQGLSCEECAKGYYRVSSSCVRCQCNGHADTCDVETGKCIGCKNGTTGDHCELCQVGYYGNATIGTPTDCLICACPLPIQSNNFATGCIVSEDGSEISCDCQEGYYGARCESCNAGYYGRPETINDTCKTCQCSGNIDPNSFDSCDTQTGECRQCLNNTYGQYCHICAPGYFGDAILRKDCRACDCHPSGMRHCDSHVGTCECHENVVGATCDRCRPDHYGFASGRGCQACQCAEASEESQCEDDGTCRCKPGVEGRACDVCMAGYWNYGSEGCTSCGCISGYSRGTHCNPETGQCECLPKVLGEKCDHCPHRHVLDVRRGCEGCDKCIDDLLDVTDALHETLEPVADSFQNVADTYFTHQRLDFFNKTIDRLLPEVRLLDPGRVDLRPLGDKIGNMRLKSMKLKKEVGHHLEWSFDEKSKAERRLNEANKLRQDVEHKLLYVNWVIDQMRSLAKSSDLQGSGPKIANALRQAKENLKVVKSVSFVETSDKILNSLNEANELFEEMENYGPGLEQIQESRDLMNSKLNLLNTKIDDLISLTRQVDEIAKNAELLVYMNKKATDPQMLETIKNSTESSSANILLGEQQNRNGSQAANEIEHNFAELRRIGDDHLVDKSEKLASKVLENEQLLKKVKSLVPRAMNHAKKLQNDSNDISNLYKLTRESPGVQASSAYEDIAKRINQAQQSAEDAKASVDNFSTPTVDNLVQESEKVQYKAERLLDSAGSWTSAGYNIRPSIGNFGKNETPIIERQNQYNQEILNSITSALGTLPVGSEPMITQEARNSADNVQYIMGVVNNNNNVDEYVSKIPDDKQRSKELSKHMSEANRDTSQANHQLDSITAHLDDVKNRAAILSSTFQGMNKTGNELYDKIQQLKRKIANARELANRFKYGLTFFPNTTLELKNPESLPLQTTSTNISLYFRTPKTNGFLLYLGNENRTDARVKAHDFMALSVENGYPVLTLDLGSGPTRIFGSQYIADNVWRQLVVDRTGRNVKLIIREAKSDGKEEAYTTEEMLPGSHSIFSLDQERSKLFVGGFPASFQMQDAVVSSSFEGEMEELMIGDVFVSFWNFLHGENNRQGHPERDSLISLQSPTGLRFDRGGYAHISKKARNILSDSTKFIIKFSFKTSANNGLMFLMGGKKNFLALEMIDGRVRYQFDIGEDAYLALVSSERYNDGNWHTVQARRADKYGILEIDGDIVGEGEAKGVGKNLVSGDAMYFGGYPPSSKYPYQSVLHNSFEGCIDNVSYFDTEIDLNKNARAMDVAPGCAVKLVRHVSFDGVHPGYVRWENVHLAQSLQISLGFKTSTPHGLIYQIVDENGSPTNTLELMDGQLTMKGRGASVSTSGARFDDNNWHYITATHNGTILRLDMDDANEATEENAPMPDTIDGGSLYVGSLPGYVTPFVGCIKDVTLNNLIVNFANTTERPHAHLGDQCPESDSVGRHFIEPPLATHPPPPSLYEESSTNVIDVSQGGDDSQPPGEIEGRPRIDSDDPIEQEVDERPSVPVAYTPMTQSTNKAETVDGCRLPVWPADDPDSENAWRFGTELNSRFEYMGLERDLVSGFDLQIELRTLNSDGIVFFAANPDKKDLIAVYLLQGKVHFSYDCGSGPAVIVSENKINDNQWHTIGFKREDTRGELLIDGQPPVTGLSGGNTKTTYIVSPVFIGGLRQSFADLATDAIGTNRTFSGCIRNFVMNGQQVDEPERKVGVLSCSKRVEPGLFFYPGNGSNWYRADDKYNVGRTFEITMDIKPRSSSGLLLAIHGPKNYVVLELVNGTVKFVVKASKGHLETSFDKVSPTYLCDGSWHTIKAEKNRNAVILHVDNDKGSTPGIGGKIGQVSSKHSIYIGGHPEIEAGKPLRGSLSNAQYVGCINNLNIKTSSYTNNIELSRLHGRVMGSICPTI